MIRIAFFVFLLFGCMSTKTSALVAGYEYDFSQADYIVDAHVVRSSAMEDGLERLEIYTLRVDSILAKSALNDSKIIFPIKEGDEIKFLYARHLGWSDTGYSAMVGKREKLTDGEN